MSMVKGHAKGGDCSSIGVLRMKRPENEPMKGVCPQRVLGMRMNCMRRNELDDCGVMVRGGNAMAGCSPWGLAGTMGGEN